MRGSIAPTCGAVRCGGAPAWSGASGFVVGLLRAAAAPATGGRRCDAPGRGYDMSTYMICYDIRINHRHAHNKCQFARSCAVRACGRRSTAISLGCGERRGATHLRARSWVRTNVSWVRCVKNHIIEGAQSASQVRASNRLHTGMCVVDAAPSLAGACKLRLHTFASSSLAKVKVFWSILRECAWGGSSESQVRRDESLVRKGE